MITPTRDGRHDVKQDLRRPLRQRKQIANSKYSGMTEPDDLEFTPSADDILEVSPVNSVADDGVLGNSFTGEMRAMRRRFHGDAGPSSSTRPKIAEDAFSSSSSEDEDIIKGRQSLGNKTAFSQSEFDKALMTGVASKGAASFETGGFQLQQESNIRKEEPVSQPPPPPPPPIRSTVSAISHRSESTSSTTAHRSVGPPAANPSRNPRRPRSNEELASGVLPDVLMSMRQKIESLSLFDSDMMKLAEGDNLDDNLLQETRDSLKRSSQQSLSAAVLVSLAHKRYERRRLAAMEIEKVVRSLVQQGEVERVRAILLLLSDDYVRSTSEDARKGGVVALAACAIGLKKASEDLSEVLECRDLILASVVHACQDHSQRVRYYATESLFNVVKVIPALAVQHFFILFEILRSLYADVDLDVRSGAELLDKKLREVIVAAINSGTFSADACVPIFARFVYMRNKATKRLTLLWLQELNEKLIGAPVLEFLHLFLGGIFAMIADPNVSIRQSALAFLQSVLPKLLVDNEAFDDDGTSTKVDFDKLIQSLVTSLEHPDPFVRKVAMYWMSRIVKAHLGNKPAKPSSNETEPTASTVRSATSASVRNALPHVLPGILLSIGDTYHNDTATKDSFLPDQTTYSLAEQTNTCLQNAVRRDGKAYVIHLDSFIVALREELDTSGGLQSRNPPAVERKPYRMDVAPDGTGIETAGWFRASNDTKEPGDTTMMSRLCALQWVIVLYESVVPDVLKADYAREFISPILRQLVDNPPELIIFKSLEVLAKITVPVEGERLTYRRPLASLSGLGASKATASSERNITTFEDPMTESSIEFALGILDTSRGQFKSRDREVFLVLIQLHACNHQLLSDLSRVIQFMCTLQPPEFVFVSFAVEIDRFVMNGAAEGEGANLTKELRSSNLEFVSSFVQQMSHVLLNTDEAKDLRLLLQDCIGRKGEGGRDQKRARLFRILLHSFSHNLIASTSLCLWAGAFRTASHFLEMIHPLDISLVFLLELDRLVELLERPLFRHLHLRMLEGDPDPWSEGSGAMLFLTLKCLLMVVPQSTCYNVLRDRLVTVARFRQSALRTSSTKARTAGSDDMDLYVDRVLEVRKWHCAARWNMIRSESLETPDRVEVEIIDEGADRRAWLGYESKEDEIAAKEKHIEDKHRVHGGVKIEEIEGFGKNYHDFDSMERSDVRKFVVGESKPSDPKRDDKGQWKDYWMQTEPENKS